MVAGFANTPNKNIEITTQIRRVYTSVHYNILIFHLGTKIYVKTMD